MLHRKENIPTDCISYICASDLAPCANSVKKKKKGFDV